MNPNLIRDLFVGLIIVVAQITIFRHLRFYGAEPEVILIFMIWLIAHRNRTTVILYSAFLGLTQDILMDLWGLNMFAKVLTVLIAYNLIPKAGDTKLLIWQAFLMNFVFAFLHNFILLSVAGLVEAYTIGAYVWIILIGNSIFTAILGSFFYFSSSK